jgi:hypothetical protein
MSGSIIFVSVFKDWYLLQRIRNESSSIGIKVEY